MTIVILDQHNRNVDRLPLTRLRVNIRLSEQNQVIQIHRCFSQGIEERERTPFAQCVRSTASSVVLALKYALARPNSAVVNVVY